MALLSPARSPLFVRQHVTLHSLHLGGCIAAEDAMASLLPPAPAASLPTPSSPGPSALTACSTVQFEVDGAPATFDLFFTNSWKTNGGWMYDVVVTFQVWGA